MTPIDKAVKHFGRTKIAEIAGVSYMAVKKWQERGRFPRTEWTGETNYAEKLAEQSQGVFTVSDLLGATNDIPNS